MNRDSIFDSDSYPGRPKILFIGLGESSHTQAWIDLLKDMPFNVRLFAMPTSGLPPADWKVRVYLSSPQSQNPLDANWRRCIRPQTLLSRLCEQGLTLYPSFDSLLTLFKKIIASVTAIPALAILKRLENKVPCCRLFAAATSDSEASLAGIIRSWRPDIVHTLGLDHSQGGLYYLNVREKYDLQSHGKWVLHLRGGSDLTLNRHDPDMRPVLTRAMQSCDVILSDNVINIDYAQDLGIKREKFSPLVPVPGAGGVDVETLRSAWVLPPSKRERLILWPKAYESQWSVALPVLEAIKAVWSRIAPCKVVMLAQSETVRQWCMDLPPEIKENVLSFDRIPRDRVLSLMSEARVLLAPSLVDGIPNVLYEAMACGAFPILSPIITISSVFKHGHNGLLARNLYPGEISDVLVKAMTDDKLVDSVASNNLAMVRSRYDRNNIRTKVADFYDALWKGV